MSGTGSQSIQDQISILYVDDEEDFLTVGERFLKRSEDFRVETMASAQEALNSLSTHLYDVIVSDYQMPEMDGIAFLRVVREKYGDVPFIIFTGRGREEVVIQAMDNGADYYLQKGGKPVSQFDELSYRIRQAVGRKQAERSHHESEKRLADIIDFLPDATFVIDHTGKVIAWNRAIEEMTGVSAREMVGRGEYEYAVPLYGFRRPILIDLITEPDETIEKFYHTITRDGDSLMAETDLLHVRGKQISAFVKASPLYNENGWITGAIESIRDITTIKEAESKFRTLVESSREGIQIFDNEGIIRFINPTGLLMLEEERYEDIIGKKNAMDYIPPEYQEQFLQERIRDTLNGNGFFSQHKLITAKKRELWVESLGKKISYQHSEVFLVSWRDISDKKQAEDALRKSEEQFRALSEQSPDIIVRVDRDYKILYCNPKITDYTGISTDDLVGTDSRKYIGHTFYVTSWVQAAQKVFDTGISTREEWKTESGYWFDCLVFPEFGVEGSVQAVTSSIRNITQMKRNEEERELFYQDLTLQRDFTQALLDAIPIPVHWKDLNQRYTGCNTAFAKFIGLHKNELIGKSIQEIWPDAEARKIALQDQEILSTGFCPPLHTKITDRTGSSHEIVSKKSLFHDFQGNVAGIVGSIQDVTAYNQGIQDLKNREEFFRMILTQSLDFFLILTPLLEITYISPRGENLSGYLAEEISGPIERFIHPDDFERIASQLERLIQNQSSSEVAEFRTLKRDGSYMLLEGVAVNCLDNPAIRGILVTSRDITQLRRTELELSRTMRLFQTVWDSSPAIFALIDREGNIIFANNAFSGLIGVSDIHTTRVSIRDILTSESEDTFLTILTDVVHTKNPVVHEVQLPGKEGNTILSTLFFPIQEEENLIIGFIGLDITEKKNLLIKLDESLVQNTALEKMVQERTEEVTNLLDLKDSLITGIAHELRTPLTPLTVLLPLLGEEEDYLKRKDMIRVIESNATRIANIVEKLLQLANLGKMYKIEDISEVNIFVVMENILHPYLMAAEKKEVTIWNEISPDLILLTSHPHLISVLDNIISNAVKYSKQGGTIRISAEEKNGSIIIHIRDDGIGMTREVLNRAFEPFFKADPSRHDRSSPGLGLSVTRRFIQAIGGEIAIESDGPGMGTGVILTFRKNP